MSADPQLGMSERDVASSVRVAQARVDVHELLTDPDRGLTPAEREEVLIDFLRVAIRRRLDHEIREGDR